jgi:hypothetical protein
MPVATTCPRCDAGDHTSGRREDGLRHRALTPAPDEATLEEWMSDSGCEASDGCWVEPDGSCEHGHSSWLLLMRLI